MGLIDKEKILSAISDCDYCDERYCSHYAVRCSYDCEENDYDVLAITNLINKFQEEESVVPVFCKDCIYWTKGKDGMRSFCDEDDIVRFSSENNYCAWGKKRYDEM